MAIFASNDGKGNITIYGASAVSDGQGHVTLLADEYEEGEVIAEDEVSLSLVDTSEYATSTEVTQTAEGLEVKINDAAKANNYVGITGDGVVVGDLTKGTLGNNVLVDLDSVDIRSGSTVLAKFAADTVELGKGSDESTIDLCRGAGTIYAMEGLYSNQRRMNLSGGDSIGITGPIAINLHTDSLTFADPYPIAQAYMDLTSADTFGETVEATARMRANWVDFNNDPGTDATVFLYSKAGTAYAQLNAADNFVTVYDDRTEATHPMTNTYQGMAFNTTHAKASTRSGFSAERSDGGTKVFFGVGSDGINHGIYSDKSAGWVVHENGDGQVFANGNVHIGQSVVSNCALASGFALYGSEAVTARKYGKVVTVTGTLKNTAAKTYDTSPVDMFTVPSGYRPSNTVYAVCQGSNFHKWVLTINTAGEAKIQRYGTASASVQAAAGSWLPFTVTYVQE